MTGPLQRDDLPKKQLQKPSAASIRLPGSIRTFFQLPTRSAELVRMLLINIDEVQAIERSVKAEPVRMGIVNRERRNAMMQQ